MLRIQNSTSFEDNRRPVGFGSNFICLSKLHTTLVLKNRPLSINCVMPPVPKILFLDMNRWYASSLPGWRRKTYTRLSNFSAGKKKLYIFCSPTVTQQLGTL